MTKQPKALKNLNKGLAVKIFALLVITFSCFVYAPRVNADDTKIQRTVYDVYAGGFHVVKAGMDIDFRKKNRYRIELDAKTRGFIGSVAPWEGTFLTEGWYNSKTKIASPQLHKSEAYWKDELEVKKYSYNKDGTFDEYRVTDVHSKDQLRDTQAELSDNTTDVMTAALQIMNSFPESGKCEGSSEIFDGKRRFKMIFSDEGEVELRSSRYNIYSGLANKCVVRVEPMGGAWHKKPRGWMSIQEQGKEKGKLPTLWMANLTEGAPAVPVKVMVRTNYGALVMHMTRYENAGEVLLADKQVEEDE